MAVEEFELSDFDADHALLEWPGVTLLVSVSQGCASCRYARSTLPALDLPVDRLAWIDAEQSGGLVSRYEVFHLPALFVIREGELCGPLYTKLATNELVTGINHIKTMPSQELP